VIRIEKTTVVPIVLLVSVTSAPLLILLGWQVAIKLPAAFRHDVLAVVHLELLIAALLVICAVGTLRAAHHNANCTFSRSSYVALLIACAISASLGDNPGLFLGSPWSSAALVLALCGVTALIVSLVDSRGAGKIAFWTVALSAVTLAAWQVSAPPFIAVLLVRN
jgi:hypothetical protein